MTLRVLAIEGEWEPDRPGNRFSVRPLLETLEQQRLASWFYRDAATSGEVLHLLDRWAGRKLFKDYRLLYLAAHGRRGTLEFSDQDLSLGELAAPLAGRCKGRAIHFGACSFTDRQGSQLKKFRQSTGAALVTGYATNVAWIESAALDLMLMSYLADRPARPSYAVSWLTKRNPVLVDQLGFVSDPPVKP